MAACGSLQHIFENSLPEKPASLLESLSTWNQMTPVKPVNQPSFIEIFGELHFKQGSDHSSSSSSSSFPMSSLSPSSSSLLDLINGSNRIPSLDSSAATPKIINDSFSSSGNSESSVHGFKYTGCHKKSDSFSSMNSESLQLCTEGLGFESSDDVEDLRNEMTEEWQNQQEKVSITKHSPAENLCGEFRRSRTSGGEFPPPISCIGKSGKPWVCFESYRHDGRFVLKEIRMPSQEFLHACREDGRLKLQFVHPNDDIQELEEGEYEEDEDEEEENGSIHDDGEGEREADTEMYEVANDLQHRDLQV